MGWGRFCRKACAHASRARPLADRFWEKVDKDGPLPERCPELGNCWVWKRSKRTEYGQVSRGGHATGGVPAHVVAWELAAGVIPPGLFVCHVCDRPACSRNDTIGTYAVAGVEYPRRGHLFLAPHAANAADAAAKGRMNQGEANTFAKLCEADIPIIRARHAAGGVSYGALGREYRVSTATISLVCRRITWPHVP